MGESEAAVQHDGIQVIGHGTRDEIMSLKVNVANKRIIVALCENDRGRFIKLTDGRARIIVPADGIAQMRDALVALESALETAPPPTADSGSTSGPATQVNHSDDVKSDLVHSQRFLSEGRKFYFDVLDNARGRFLKISQSSTRRITMIMPVAGLSLLRQAINMLLEKAPPDTTVTDPSSVQRMTRTIERVTPMNDGASVTLNVVQREIRVLGKRVVFESGANRRGSYIKIMENSGSQRMTVMLPHSAVPEMIQLLQEVVDAGDPADALTAQNGQS